VGKSCREHVQAMYLSWVCRDRGNCEKAWVCDMSEKLWAFHLVKLRVVGRNSMEGSAMECPCRQNRMLV